MKVGIGNICTFKWVKHLNRNEHMQLKIQITASDDENQSGAFFNSMLAEQCYTVKMQYSQ